MATQTKTMTALSCIRWLVFLTTLVPSFASAIEDCPVIVSQSPYITHSLDWLGLKSCIRATSHADHQSRWRCVFTSRADPVTGYRSINRHETTME